MIASLIVVWIVIFLTHHIFQLLFHWYYRMLQDEHICVKPFYVKCLLTSLPRWMIKYSKKRKFFLHKWFNVGSFLSCMLLFPSAAILFASAYRLTISHGEHLQFQTFQPVIPGFNIPFSDLSYYIFSLLLCSIVHEFGHAVAALSEDVAVDRYGIFILVALPAAFVTLKKDNLFNLCCIQRLRIFCAGVWHNIVLTALSFFLLLFLPHMMSPFYVKGEGITVMSIDKESILSGSSGFSVGDKITMVGSCKIDSAWSWKVCLQDIAIKPQFGFCVSENFIETKREIGPETLPCCPDSLLHVACFQYYWHRSSTAHRYACLPARKIFEREELCQSNYNCSTSNEICIVPYMDSNSTRLVSVTRKNRDSVIFIGSIKKLYSCVKITSWTSKYDCLPVSVIHIVETILKYLISFSAALTILNMIPCPGLDGAWIWETVLMWIFGSKYHIWMPHLMNIMKACGLFLIIFNIAFGTVKTLLS